MTIDPRRPGINVVEGAKGTRRRASEIRSPRMTARFPRPTSYRAPRHLIPFLDCIKTFREAGERFRRARQESNLIKPVKNLRAHSPLATPATARPEEVCEIVPTVSTYHCANYEQKAVRDCSKRRGLLLKPLRQWARPVSFLSHFARLNVTEFLFHAFVYEIP